MKRILTGVILTIAAFCTMNKLSAQSDKVTMIFTVYVDDYDAWKTKFDGGAQFRENAGIKVISISRNIDDMNSITIIEEAPDKATANDFLEKLKALREKNNEKVLAMVELFQSVQ